MEYVRIWLRAPHPDLEGRTPLSYLNVSQCTEAIAHWMQQHDGEAVSLLGLQQGLGMPLVDIWLGLLLSQEQQYE